MQSIEYQSSETEYWVWWLSQDECEAIGDYPPGSVPEYIRVQYHRRMRRDGRGRLWADRHLGPVGMLWDTTKPASRLAATRGGIVINADDAEHVFALPGFLTTLELDFINVLAKVQGYEGQTP